VENIKLPSFLRINPLGQVPALTDGERNLYESSSIIRYLGNKYHCDAYPFRNLKKFGKIDVAYTHIRSSGGLWDVMLKLVYNMFLVPYMFHGTVDENLVAKLKNDLDAVLTGLNDNYFKTTHHCMVDDHICIADLAVATALSELSSMGISDYSKYGKVHEFWVNIQNNEAYRETQAGFEEIVKAFHSHDKK